MKHDFKVNDTVRIIDRRPDSEDSLWASSMDNTLGKEGVIKHISTSGECCVEIQYENDSNIHYWWYLPEWLTPVESKAKSDWFSDSFLSIPWPSLDFRRCKPIKAPEIFSDSLLSKPSPANKLTLINTTKLLTHIKLD